MFLRQCCWVMEKASFSLSVDEGVAPVRPLLAEGHPLAQVHVRPRGALVRALVRAARSRDEGVHLALVEVD